MLSILFTITGCNSDEEERAKVLQKIALAKQKYEQNKIHLPDKYVIQTKKGKDKGTFFQANYVWAYTSEFAKRFDMPTHFIDDTLQGASAIAFTVQDLNSEMCGFAGRRNNCSQVSNCYYDFYINDTVDLPWKNEQKSGFARTADFSYYYLSNSKSTMTNENSIDWNIEENRRDLDYRKLAFDVTVWSYTSHKKNARAGAELNLYKRPLIKGLNYFRVKTDCGKPARPDLVMQFSPIDTLKLDFNNPTSHKIYIPASIAEFFAIYNKAKQKKRYH